MKVLVIGSGGREHALAWRLKHSPLVSEVLAAPGNPGMAAGGVRCIPAGGNYLQIEADLTIVGPETPLLEGIVDSFRAAGRAIVGPTAAAAQLEGSKVFAKDFFVRHGIPTARYTAVDDLPAVLTAIDQFDLPVVLKADGLAAGKGVIIANTRDEAVAAAHTLLSGHRRLIIEEFLTGEEVSFIALCDGNTILPMLPAQDHKAIHDGDKGPNTGGMGAYVDDRILTPQQTEQVMRQILVPTVRAMEAEGAPFTGFLYAGLMITASGPKILEYNVRLGDPETQPLMHRLRSDLAATLLACAERRLAEAPFEWSPDPSVSVVLAAQGYPEKPRTGDIILGAEACGATVFHAGTKMDDGTLRTAGGRVLSVTASGSTLQSAIDSAYRAVDRIHFDGMQFRNDIGRKGLRRW